MTSTGYTRQSSANIVTGNTIQASDFNNEYNQLQAAFDAIVGHTHNGASGQGGPITATGLVSVVAGGTDNDLTITITGFTLVTGSFIIVTPSANNTGNATLTVNGGTTYPILKTGESGFVQLDKEDLFIDFPALLYFDGTEWIYINILFEGVIEYLSTNYVLSNANDLFNYIIATAALSITLPASNSLPKYYYNRIYASSGNITLIPNGTDTIQGVNSNFTIYQGTSGFLYTDALGSWFLNGTCAGALPANAGGTGISNNNTITLGGNVSTGGALTLSGTNSVTLTSTGTTSLTLPTSGTLATLAGSETLSNKTLVAPILGTPASGNLANCTFPTLNQNTSGSAGSVAAANITGTTLAAGVTGSSLTSVGTITSGVWNGTAITSTYLPTATTGALGIVKPDGTTITITGGGTISATTGAAGTLTGTTLASNVVTSSLTSFGASIALGTPASGTLTNCTGYPSATSAALGIVQTDNTSIAATAGVISAILTPQGRLSLISGSPINTSDTSAATTVYYVPYTGENIPIYNGTTFACLSIGSQISLALDSNSGHTGYQQSGKLFDLFVYSSSGTPTLATGPAWTNSTTRANNIALKNGIWTNSGTITLRFGTVSGNTASITTNQATYVGTMYASANGQCTMVQKPAAATGGGNTIMGLYNAYNRIKMFGLSQDNTSTWSYGTATWRATNNNTNNRISFVDGLGYSNISTKITGAATGSGVDFDEGIVGVNLNSTSATPVVCAATEGTAAATAISATACDEFYPVLGLSFAQAMEYGGGSTNTWYGLMNSQQIQSLSLNIEM